MNSQDKTDFTSKNQLGDGFGTVVLEEEDGLSPVSSRYSSCEESEFDRYCSANSVMGTPASVCSSIGFLNDSLDSDFGSFNSLDGFKLGAGRVSRLKGKSGYRTLTTTTTQYNPAVVRSGGDCSLMTTATTQCDPIEMRSGGDCLLTTTTTQCDPIEMRSRGDCSLMKTTTNECDPIEMRSRGDCSLTTTTTQCDPIEMRSRDDCSLMTTATTQCDPMEVRFGGDCSFTTTAITQYDPIKVRYGGDRSLLGRKSCLGNGLRELDGHGEGVEGGEGLSSSGGTRVVDGEVGKKGDLAVILKNVENVLLQGAVAARSAAENLMECNHADEMDDERCREQDEHSEGEDSMFNYGSDDDDGSHRQRGYYVGDHHHRHKEDGGCGDLMLMNPSVAFGCNDWEDFELDGMGNMNNISEDFWVPQQSGCGKEIDSQDSVLNRTTPVEKFQWREEETNGRDVLTDDDDTQEVDESLECSITNVRTLDHIEGEGTEGSRGVLGEFRQITNNDESDEYLENCSVYNVFQKRSPTEDDVGENERKNPGRNSERSSGLDYLPVQLQSLNSPPHILAGEDPLRSDDHEDLKLDVLRVEGARVELPSSEGVLTNSASKSLESDEERMFGDSHIHDSQNSSSQANDFEINGIYDEFVHDMEEILLESCGSPGSTLKQKNCTEFQYEQYSSLRNDGSISSGFEDGNLLTNHPLKIDKVEVVSTKQKKGDISLSERLVGVKEYTVYVIRIWSGKYQWDVERRYRDFYALYHQLKTYFAARGWILPPVWSSADRESRIFFGSNSPNVVAERSTLIQQCLSAVLQSRYCSNLPSALIWFLSPPESLLSSSWSNDVIRDSNVGPSPERVPSLGKTISLIVDIRSHKSVKELLDAQHYTCAGCHTQFNQGKSRMLEIVHTFGWGKPRFCEYTGQLFCSSCHTNETAVLPARVLHNWDFSLYPVSQMAKSYLDSIIDKPMLCVSAANPFLFSRVPALLNAVGVRRKIGAMLPYIRCSFRRSIYRRLGYRKYLLESNDFFALRDLVDLSKGAFAGLPSILEAVLKKIEEHITQLCLECCDNGVPCGARQSCHDLSSLIFPFQEDEILRCKSCKSVFHKHCFNKLVECPCGEVLRPNAGNIARSSSLVMKKSDSKSSSSLLPRLLSFSRPEKGQKEKDNVILMGSLPCNSL